MKEGNAVHVKLAARKKNLYKSRWITCTCSCDLCPQNSLQPENRYTEKSEKVMLASDADRALAIWQMSRT